MKSVFSGLKKLSLIDGSQLGSEGAEFKFNFDLEETNDKNAKKKSRKKKKKNSSSSSNEVCPQNAEDLKSPEDEIIEDAPEIIIPNEPLDTICENHEHSPSASTAKHEDQTSYKTDEFNIGDVASIERGVSMEGALDHSDEPRHQNSSEQVASTSTSKRKSKKKKKNNIGEAIASQTVNSETALSNIIKGCDVIDTNLSVKKSPPGLTKAYPKSGLRFLSPHDPELDSKSKMFAKYGNGKNLVAIGPKKVKDPLWLRDNDSSDYVNQIAADTAETVLSEPTETTKYHHSPFTFSFGGL